MAVVMDGLEDYGGQHGQAAAIAAGMSGLGHEVCYVSRWPLVRQGERLATLRRAGVEVLTPRWLGGRTLGLGLLPTPDNRARLRRLLRASWRQRTLPSRALMTSAGVPDEAASDFARIATGLLERWRKTRTGDLPLVVHVVARGSAQYLDRLKTIGAPVVFSEFGQLALYGLDLERADRLMVDACTADSPEGARDLEQLESQRVSFIPCIAGFDSEPTAVGDHAERFALTNRLVASKRTETAVEAAALGRFELDMLGSGPEEQRLLDLVEKLGLSGRVRLHGLATRSEIQAALDAADGLVLCSLPPDEGTPMGVIEAMSRARPVVAYPTEGVQALVRDGVEGLSFDGSPASLAASLNRLVDEPGLARRLGLAARERWERELRPSALIARYEAIYRDVLSRARPR
ncbi:MAG TPA: glycosyltransferase [Gaiellaceae bacterium]|nr:glycosyltransferase [Gaiellaceae bacterium]